MIINHQNVGTALKKIKKLNYKCKIILKRLVLNQQNWDFVANAKNKIVKLVYQPVMIVQLIRLLN